MKIWQFITISHQVRRCLNFLKSLGNVSLIMIGKRNLAVFTPALLSDRRDVGYLPVWRSNTFSQQNGRSQPFIIITISKTRRKYKQQVYYICTSPPTSPPTPHRFNFLTTCPIWVIKPWSTNGTHLFTGGLDKLRPSTK